MSLKFDFDDVRFWVNITAFLSVAVGVVIGQDFSFMAMEIFDIAKDGLPFSSQSFSIIVGMEGALLGFVPAYHLLTYQANGLLYSKIWMVIALICLLGQLLFAGLSYLMIYIYAVLSLLCFLSLLLFSAQNFLKNYISICRMQIGFWQAIKKQHTNK